MRKAVKLRSLTTEDETEILKLAASRKAAHRLVQRAKVIVAMLDDPKLHATLPRRGSKPVSAVANPGSIG